MTIRYPLNTQVTVRITRAIFSGLLGTIDENTHAIVRNREIAWETPRPTQEYIGNAWPAIVIGYNPAYKELELSLRLVERDPWQTVPQRYPVRSRVQGRIVGLIEAGAFVELEPGVEAFLPRWGLTEGEEPVEKLVWVGDEVRALVVESDPPVRKLLLSARALLEARDKAFQQRLWGTTRAARPAHTTVAAALSDEEVRGLWRLVPGTQQPPALKPITVLLIEDDDLCAAGLKNLLRRNGCQVERVCNGYEGVAKAREAPFQLILIDWNLPGLKGHEIVDQLAREGCEARLILLAAFSPADEPADVWERLARANAELFSKANGAALEAGLVAVLQELRDGREDNRPTFRLPAETRGSLMMADPAIHGDSLSLGDSAGKALDEVLAGLQRDTGATTALLLRVGPEPPGLHMEACTGRPFPVEQVTFDLIYSPLADILNEKQEVYERVAADSVRFARLLRLLPFEGFLGLPLPAPDKETYGLILLKARGGFRPHHLQEARSAAYLLAGTLQERRLLRMLHPWQVQYLAGQLGSTLMHEVTGKLLAVRGLVQSLEEDLRELLLSPAKAEDPKRLSMLLQTVGWIMEAERQAEQLRDQYLGLTVDDKPGPVEIQELLEGLVGLLRAEAQRSNILLELRLPDDLPPVVARPSELRQIFLNLLMNAIQQMRGIGRKGCVIIEGSESPEDGGALLFRITDDGPGIHAHLLERIFDFGFTLRQEGAGLGLTIARRTAQALGGELRVEQSYILWGTTFFLKLPKGA